MSDAGEPDVEDLIEQTQTRGADDPEREITDLQDLLRAAWALMTVGQRTALIESDEAQAILEPEDDPEGMDEE